MTQEKKRTIVPIGPGGTGLMPADIDQLVRASQLLGQAFQVPPAEAFARCAAGADLGLPPSVAIANLAIYKGNVLVKGKIMLAQVLQSGKARTIKIDQQDDHTTVYSERNDQQPGDGVRTTFDLERAKSIRVWSKGQQIPLLDKWQKNGFYIPDMLKWKAVARNLDMQFPDVTLGMAIREDYLDHLNGSRDEAPKKTDAAMVVPTVEGTDPLEVLPESTDNAEKKESAPSATEIRPEDAAVESAPQKRPRSFNMTPARRKKLFAVAGEHAKQRGLEKDNLLRTAIRTLTGQESTKNLSRENFDKLVNGFIEEVAIDMEKEALDRELWGDEPTEGVDI